MKIGLDFDKTVFDTESFVQQMPTDPDVFKKAFEKAYLSGEYTLEKHVDFLEEQGVSTDKDRLRQLYEKSPTYLRYRDYLQELSANHDLYLVTRADTKGWQQRKIAASDAEQYFKDIFIVYDDSLKDVPELDVLVDDSREELEDVSEETALLRPEEGLRSTLSDFID